MSQTWLRCFYLLQVTEYIWHLRLHLKAECKLNVRLCPSGFYLNTMWHLNLNTVWISALLNICANYVDHLYLWHNGCCMPILILILQYCKALVSLVIFVMLYKDLNWFLVWSWYFWIATLLGQWLTLQADWIDPQSFFVLNCWNHRNQTYAKSLPFK